MNIEIYYYYLHEIELGNLCASVKVNNIYYLYFIYDK